MADVGEQPSGTRILGADTLLALWTAQDGLLQQYRSVFIAIHTAMISAGGLMFGNSARSVPFLVLATVALLLVPVWVATCRRRVAIAHAAQYMLAKSEAGFPVSHPLRILRMAQSGNTLGLVGDPYVDEFEAPTKFGTVLFERVVPAVFLLAWLALLFAHFVA